MTAKNPYNLNNLCDKYCAIPSYLEGCEKDCILYQEEAERAFAWNTGYTKGQTDLRNELETDPKSFIQLFEDIVFNEKNLTDEQLKQFHQLYNNQVIYLQKEAHRRGLEL